MVRLFEFLFLVRGDFFPQQVFLESSYCEDFPLID